MADQYICIDSFIIVVSDHQDDRYDVIKMNTFIIGIYFRLAKGEKDCFERSVYLTFKPSSENFLEGLGQVQSQIMKWIDPKSDNYLTCFKNANKENIRWRIFEEGCIGYNLN